MGKHLEKQHCEGQTYVASSSGRSHSANLLAFPKDLTATIYKGNSVDIVHWDFQQVFDKDQHQRLMAGGRSIGVGFKIKACVEIRPKSMRQKGAIAKSVSNWKDVESDVSWRSVLIICVFHNVCWRSARKHWKQEPESSLLKLHGHEWFFTSTDYGRGPKRAQCPSWFGMCLRHRIPSDRREPEREKRPLWPSCNTVSSTGNTPTVETWHGETAIYAMETQHCLWRKDKWSKLDSIGIFLHRTPFDWTFRKWRCDFEQLGNYFYLRCFFNFICFLYNSSF